MGRRGRVWRRLRPTAAVVRDRDYRPRAAALRTPPSGLRAPQLCPACVSDLSAASRRRATHRASAPCSTRAAVFSQRDPADPPGRASLGPLVRSSCQQRSSTTCPRRLDRPGVRPLRDAGAPTAGHRGQRALSAPLRRWRRRPRRREPCFVPAWSGGGGEGSGAAPGSGGVCPGARAGHGGSALVLLCCACRSPALGAALGGLVLAISTEFASALGAIRGRGARGFSRPRPAPKYRSRRGGALGATAASWLSRCSRCGTCAC